MTNALAVIDGSSHTRSGYGRKIIGSEVAGAGFEKNTRSGESVNLDSLLYIVSFADNAGYAILAADKRLGSQIIAIVDQGLPDLNFYRRDNAVMEQEMESPTKFMADCIMNHAILSVLTEGEINKEYEEESDPETRSIGSLSSWVPFTVERVRAKLRTKWDQIGPFNQVCQANEPNGNFAGCGPVAIGQIFLYYAGGENLVPSYMDEYLITNGFFYRASDLQPVYSYYDSNQSWGTDYQQERAAHFLWRIGKYTKSSYKSKATSTTWDNARKYFKDHNFEPWGEVHSFDYNFIKKYLNGGYVLLALGEDKSGSGHFWIVDGYEQVKEGSNTLYSLAHINWGWGGSGDGYYNYNILNANDSTSSCDEAAGDNYFGGFWADYHPTKKFKLYAPKPKFDSPVFR